ncbi:RNA-binding domain-containing protein [Meira miltonrushii]|uniref:RNA-binding domain-containing protein n=1 Tax=Meira miltonrushii TaxID=1280837 RepID=A0A316VJ55_9BASI|nr:RNA-binding domain-containing protein [Meira miltonrushii]PWN37254.1 RNA-binding domain-containing protein [Meira miltonrushii]
MSGSFNRGTRDTSRQTDRNARSSPYLRHDSRADQDKWKHDKYNQRDERLGNRIESRGNSSSIANTPSAKLIVKGLHYEIGNDELMEIFQRIGPIAKASVRYDRTGRSVGVATVIYADQKDAIRAKQEYDGANAKGHPLSISFEPMREDRIAQSGSSGGKGLLERLQGGGSELSARIGGTTGSQRGVPPPNAPKGPASEASSHPQQSRQRGGRGGRGFSRGGGRGGRRTKGPAPTSDSLDAELDDFMKNTSGSNGSMHAPPSQDVEMK